MHNQWDFSQEQLVREKALYRYLSAFERGDFESMGTVLQRAVQDQLLEAMIIEAHKYYQAEERITLPDDEREKIVHMVLEHLPSDIWEELDEVAIPSPAVADIKANIQQDQALDASEKVRLGLRAKALVDDGELATMLDDFSLAEELYAEGLALYRELGDRHGSATVLSRRGYIAMMRSNYAEARALLEEALALFREVSDQGGCAFVLYRMATVLVYQGEYTRAQALLEERLLLSRVVGDVQGQARALALLVQVLLFQDDLAPAQALLEESLALSRQEGYKDGIASSLLVSGQVALQQFKLATARSQTLESLALFKELGDWQNVSHALNILAMIVIMRVDYVRAHALLEESLSLARAVGGKWHIAECLVGLGVVAAAYKEAMWPEKEATDKEAMWAARLFGAAQTLCEAIQGVLPPFMRERQEWAIAAVQTQLGKAVFAAAWAEGCTLTLEQVMAAQEAWTAPTTFSEGSSFVPHTQKAPLYPDPAGLTECEAEVLRLVAEGLTDVQVADHLIISPHRVNSHLKSIYCKIGVPSRSAATRYAIEHGLL